MPRLARPRTILITGASSGIGAALAALYADPGITLMLIGRDSGRLEETAGRCRRAGAQVVTRSLDITDYRRLERVLIELDEQAPVELLIVAAGINHWLRPGERQEQWPRTRLLLDTNLHGAIATVLPMLARMRRRRRGQVALISSLAAYRGLPSMPAYSASKAALKAWGEALRPVAAGDGVGVSVVCPGPVRTPMNDDLGAPQPFRLEPQQAAQRIRRGLAADRACIAFPLPLVVGTRLLALLPAALADPLLRWLGYGPPAGQ